ncbi:MAG: class I SAM-dependent methyltransferase [Candidatus Abawacabacteria bacterium]|nr:class I SAM-dependent methyltransferase [Candidatus Abawacabacteria bacterium]
MLAFLHDPSTQLILEFFHVDVAQLELLWDMPLSVQEVIRSIIAYDEREKVAQEGAVTKKDRFHHIRAWPVEFDTACLLYLLVRYFKPTTILECGTSFGVSAIAMASGLKTNGLGKLVTVEVSKLKHEAAWQNFVAAGVEQYIVQEKMAFDQYLKKSTVQYDMVLLDCDRSRYSFYFATLLPNFVPQTLLLADNAIDKAKDMVPLQVALDKCRWQHRVMKVGDGLLISKYPGQGGS